jgi:hypothetical protein
MERVGACDGPTSRNDPGVPARYIIVSSCILL